MRSTASVLVANEPGKTIEAPFRFHEPIYFLLQRLSWELGIEDLNRHQLTINGFTLDDDQKSLAEYRIYGNCLTYKYWLYNQMSVNVRVIAGKTIRVSCHPADTIISLKERIHKLGYMPVDEQRLEFNGCPMEDFSTLQSFGIQNDDTLRLMLRLCGGDACGASATFQFASMSKESVQKVELCHSGTPGLRVFRGTNIECRCECTKKYRVVCPQEFSVIELEKTAFVCPICRCSNKTTPVTAGFRTCEYRFLGVKASGEQCTSEWIDVRPEDNYQTFDPKSQVQWRRLMIQSKPRGEADVCSVCLGPRKGTRAFGCGHFFHDNCYKMARGCAVCKHDKQLRMNAGL